MLGGGPEAGRLEEKVERLGMGTTVELAGLQRDVGPSYRAAECFVLASTEEGSSNAVLEAMASGVPVITSNTSSLPEVVGNAALLIDPESEEELRSAILKVTSAPTLQQSMSEKGLARATKFSWEQIARDTLKVYETC